MVAIDGKSQLATARRIVVKIGSSLLVSANSASLREKWMQDMGAEIQRLRQQGSEIILVSSGAVALGRKLANMGAQQLKLEEKQALAALGQVELAKAWADVFGLHGVGLGQVLLTLDDTENRRRWLNCSSTLHALLQMNTVPLINENDSVASDEIRFGDNDRLAARTAQMISADLLILLSDVDGLYDRDPANHNQARHIPLVDKITPDIMAMAGGAGTKMGSGGMITKLLAAKIAASAGCATVIADGRVAQPVCAIREGAKCTLFQPQLRPEQARKNWISGSLQPKGKLIIDPGADAALGRGASLLAAGITKVEGSFERGEVVSICLPDGKELARGLISYGASEARSIQGLQSAQIRETLGYDARKAVVHRDNLVLTGKSDR